MAGTAGRELAARYDGPARRQALPPPQGRNVARVISDSNPPAGGIPEDLAVPAIPASAGALIFDRSGRLLILKPTYKSGWTIPGGVMEADGETPWQACRREVREECGIKLRRGRLACVDFRRPRPGSPGGIRFLFDCGSFGDSCLAAITMQAEEICEHRLAVLPDALPLLRGPIRRRVRAATSGLALVYLEEGRPVAGVGTPHGT
jgi:8-oxo-dGTP diphosphatase